MLLLVATAAAAFPLISGPKKRCVGTKRLLAFSWSAALLLLLIIDCFLLPSASANNTNPPATRVSVLRFQCNFWGFLVGTMLFLQMAARNMRCSSAMVQQARIEYHHGQRIPHSSLSLRIYAERFFDDLRRRTIEENIAGQLSEVVAPRGFLLGPVPRRRYSCSSRGSARTASSTWRYGWC